MRHLLSLALWIFLPTMLFAQPENYSTRNENAIKYYAKGRQLVDFNRLDEAILLLQQAIQADEKFLEAHLVLGDVYRLKRNYAGAVLEFGKAVDINPWANRQMYYKLGEAEVNTGRYKEAQTHLVKYLSFPNITDKDRLYAKKLITDCEFAVTALQNPVQFKPVNLGPEINTKDDEYLPVTTADESTLIFTRRINNNEDFYKSGRVKEQWQPAVYLSDEINTPNFNEGAQSISQDGKYLFFTGCNRPIGKVNYGRDRKSVHS